jgi:YidC/Oxa1 family membrane protein insertase
VVDYGWLTIIAAPLFWVLDLLVPQGTHRQLGLGHHSGHHRPEGAVLPAVRRQLQVDGQDEDARPAPAALKEQYGDDKMKMQQAMMELYKREKVNPLGGCLPILIQIPVFIALYWVLLGVVEMRGAPWLGWIQDLSVKDPYYILPLIMGATSSSR